MKSITFFAAALFAVCFCLNAFAEEVHVKIRNELSDDMKIKVHCQAGDQSLGTQTIVKGMAIEWRIDDSTPKTSPYYCDVEWNEVDGYHFEVYSEGRDRLHCRSACSWHVTEQGPLLQNQKTGSWEAMPFNPLPGKKETVKLTKEKRGKMVFGIDHFDVEHLPVHAPPHKCICWPPKE